MLFLSSIILIIWWSVYSFRDVYLDQQRNELLTSVQLLKADFKEHLEINNISAIAKLCLSFSKTTKARISVIRKDGYVLSDSHEDISRMGDHSDRPEFMDAIKNRVGESIRYSLTLSSSLMYIAIPIENNEGHIFSVLRISKPISEINDQLHRMYKDNLWVIIILLIFTSVLTWTFSKSISSPIEEIIVDINSMPKDEWTGISTTANSNELCSLVDSLNNMGVASNRSLKLIEKEAKEQEAIFRNMQEGIIALDKFDKIIKINDAALKMFCCETKRARDKGIDELVRNYDFMNLLNRLKNKGESIVEDIVIPDELPKIIQVKANVISGQSNEFFGSLFVLADITQFRMLETMRRDFVSNVSHELKTPLTSIKGYVETLLYSRNVDPELNEKFLKKLNKNADRLQSIIEDLLLLSKVEQDGLKKDELEDVKIYDIVNHIVDICQQKKLPVEKLKIICEADISIKAHQSLLSQALFNLLDNAYKYSDSNPEIRIQVLDSKDAVRIAINDSGPGIEESHIPHLLERFYRVDKARSRDKGGTGLGLSIVKHIVQAHHGHMEISSQIGVGSTFTIILPKTNLTEF